MNDLLTTAPVTAAEASEAKYSISGSSAVMSIIRLRWNEAICAAPPSVWNQSPAISVWT